MISFILMTLMCDSVVIYCKEKLDGVKKGLRGDGRLNKEITNAAT